MNAALEMLDRRSHLQSPRTDDVASTLSKRVNQPSALMIHFHNLAGTRTTSCPAWAFVPMLNGTTATQALRRYLHSDGQAPRFRTTLVVAGDILRDEDPWSKLEEILNAEEALTVHYLTHACQPGFRTEIQDSIHARSAAALQRLLERYADPNMPLQMFNHNTDWRPLHLATCLGAKNIVRLLLMAEANVEEGHPSKPLATACLHGDAQIGGLLLQARANPNTEDGNGQAPLHIAAAVGSTRLVRLLIQSAADIEQRGSRQQSALHAAALNGSPALLRLLISSAADIAAQDCKGRCPLDLLPSRASFTQRFRCRQLLDKRQQRKTPNPMHAKSRERQQESKVEPTARSPLQGSWQERDSCHSTV